LAKRNCPHRPVRRTNNLQGNWGRFDVLEKREMFAASPLSALISSQISLKQLTALATGGSSSKDKTSSSAASSSTPPSSAAAPTTESSAPSSASAVVVTELNLKNFGAFGDGKSHPITQTQLETRGWSGKYKVGEQWDTIAWQEATAAATAGMTINVPKGTYLVSGQLTLKSDVQWIGKSATFKSVGADAVVLKYSNVLQNVTIKSIAFQNLAFEFRGNTQESISNVQFQSCAFNG
jgi:hypothetical protein